MRQSRNFRFQIQQLETKEFRNKNCESNFEKPETRNRAKREKTYSQDYK